MTKPKSIPTMPAGRQAKHPLVSAEEATLNFWQAEKIFAKSLAQDSPQGEYVFYDGPPFATGTPHYGHILASAIKDAVPRFWTMRGYHVARRWGWDCHGLPIENIVEKELGVKSKKELLETVGVAKFNALCREQVLGYVDEWKTVISRLGRWADMDQPYQTMDLDYMESVWWVFKELWDKGLIYENYRSIHVCPRCETTLSQYEVSDGYKMIKDLSVTAKFELVDEPGTYILAWTTTPWTLPGNVALAINPDVDYVRVESEGSTYILAKDLVEKVFADRKFKIGAEITVADLLTKKYRPLFDDYLAKDFANKENIYTIVTEDFVNTEEGTGVVHIAPAFGGDDYSSFEKYHLPFIQHVNMNGTIKEEVAALAGLSVKPIADHQSTDVEIIKILAAKGLLFSKEKFEHSYPHCWRCDTPLINYATSSWFVAVTKIKARAEQLAEQINWSPNHIKDGRFGNWLAGARDWSISRQRFWASVIPVWRCDCGADPVVFGSVADLEKASGTKITDLHKDSVDLITFPCVSCGKEMHRVPDVLDTWFDSGSMPYAQAHYPFVEQDKFDNNFPAQFIGEGIDQTRAWFYYLHILGTAIMDRPAFSNVIVNGIMLAEDGKKMAKKLKNYPDPMELVDRYGADALRYYLLSSPAVGAENLNFSEKGVKEVFQNVVMLTNNILSFYQLYAGDAVQSDKNKNSESLLDRWLIGRLQQVIETVTGNMERYDLAAATRPLPEFINEFSTWWLRRSRDRFKSDNLADRQAAIATCRQVLETLAQLLAPFTPFISENVYRSVSNEYESVHLSAWPIADSSLIDEKLMADMVRAQQIVEMALASRAEHGIKVRQPLSLIEVTGMAPLAEELDQIIMDEVNVKAIKYGQDGELAVALNTELTPELQQEGLLRELIRSVNEQRKKSGLTIHDRIIVDWQTDSVDLRAIITGQFLSELQQGTLSNAWQEGQAQEEYVINGEKIKLTLTVQS